MNGSVSELVQHLVSSDETPGRMQKRLVIGGD